MASTKITIKNNIRDVVISGAENGQTLIYQNGVFIMGSPVSASGGGDMYRIVYDADNDGIVDNAETLQGNPASYFSPSGHTHALLHDPATVADSSSINLSISGQEISGVVIPAGIAASDLNSGSAPLGYVLTSDGDGTLSWQAPSASGTVSGNATVNSGWISPMQVIYSDTFPGVVGTRYMIGATSSGVWADYRGYYATMTASGWVLALPNIMDAAFFLNEYPGVGFANATVVRPRYFAGVISGWLDFVARPIAHAILHSKTGNDPLKITDLIVDREVPFGGYRLEQVGEPVYDTDAATKYYVDSHAVVGSGGGDMMQSVYDTNNDGVVDNAGALNGHADTYFATSDHTHAQLHDPVTVSDTTTVDLSLTGQALSASVIPAGIKLDDLGTPDDNTDLNASTSNHGLLPKLPGGTSTYLRGDGTWATVSGGAASSGVSGNVTYSGTAVARATHNDGDLYFPTDNWTIDRQSGVSYVSYGPIYRLVKPPALNTWTWENQATATAAETNGGIRIESPAAAGVSIRGLYRAVPATPYSVTMCISPQIFFASANAVGVYWRQSSDGKIADCQIDGSTGELLMRIRKYTSATVYNSEYMNIGGSISTAPLLWIRLRDSGTNRIISISKDGQNFYQMHSITRLDFLTSGADGIGFYALPNNATYGVAITLLSYEETYS